MSPLLFIVILLSLILIIYLLNNKIFKIQNDIALVLGSFIIALVILLLSKINIFNSLNAIIDNYSKFNFEEYLIEGVLCFMLFAGASKLNVEKFKENIKPISMYAFISTALSVLIFGGIFYLINLVLKLNLNIFLCILIGCIVSPTDPIAATSILNKLGLNKNVSCVIESESLFNDGVGVVLFIFFKSIVTSQDSNFFIIMLKEIGGAILVGFVVSIILFYILKHIKNNKIHILISILTVSLSYVICEHFGFSGVIASVICGIYYAVMMHKIRRERIVYDEHNLYEEFWETLDTILNNMLFVMIGLSVVLIPFNISSLYIIPIAIIIVLISRFIAILIPTSVLFNYEIPGNYSKLSFTSLLTWTALKGGLSLALALSCRSFIDTNTLSIILVSTYGIILFSIIIQGLTIKPIYYKLESLKR